MKKTVQFIKTNAVALIAFTAAVITSFFIPPDSLWLGYFDFKTLACLFSVLAVVCALKNIHFFAILAENTVRVTGNLKTAVLTLCLITLFGSMLIANDMALLTFLPLGYFVLTSTGQEKYMAHVFILQNIAANLGGMLTPFGNPQNLYLYTRFSIPTLDFMKTMLMPFIISIVMIVGCCFIIIPSRSLTITSRSHRFNKTRAILLGILFFLAVFSVFRVVHWGIVTAIVVITLLILDRHALREVDWGLLFTFVCFFIFSGNLSRIEVVRNFFEMLLDKSTLLVSVLCCQIISNVPSSILLANFTENWQDLLVGVNIGGLGTLISSLASLITFREYTSHNKGKTLYYLGLFSLYNFSMLLILVLFEIFL